MIMIGEVEMIGMVMIRVVMIKVIVIIILAIFKEEAFITLYSVDLLLTTDATRPRGRDEFFGCFSPRLFVCTWIEWSVCVCVCERERYRERASERERAWRPTAPNLTRCFERGMMGQN